MDPKSPDALTLDRLGRAVQEVSSTRSRLKKIELLAAVLAGHPLEVQLVVVSYLCGELPQGRVGIGPALLREVWSERPPETEDRLGLLEVDALLERLSKVSGTGSKARRKEILLEVLAATSSGGQEFFLRLLSGGLRQGALSAVVEMAVVRGAEVDSTLMRRAVTLLGSLLEASKIALADGDAGLLQVKMAVFRPLSPMLAAPAASLADALEKWGAGGFWELKLDGARIQVHRQGQAVRVYSRSLRDVTASLPEVVAIALDFPESQFVLDGEVLALQPDGRCCPFQETMRRFGRRAPTEELLRDLPMRPYFFDILMLGQRELLEQPFRCRRQELEALAGEYVVQGRTTDSPTSAQQFFAEAVESGFEGLMIKSLEGLYEAGRRGSHWLKLKPFHTLDLVVLAVEWGSGRRRGWLSNLHLGARAEDGEFVMLGKTFKGLSDKVLEWQTKRLLQLEVERRDGVVQVRPELVVEIAFTELQVSSQYSGGLALRFARVKRYRPDKKASQADTIETVREIFRGSALRR